MSYAPDKPMPVLTRIGSIGMTVPVCPPGDAFSYSNVGYVLIGYLVEVITGMSWPDAVRGMARDAETKLTPGERISLQNDIWASKTSTG